MACQTKALAYFWANKYRIWKLTTPQWATKPQKKKKELVNLNDKDWLLQTLITTINRIDGYNLPITLTTHGFLISGEIISGREYFNSMAEKFIGEGNAIRQFFEGVAESRYSKSDKDDDDPKNTVFIHLRDARFYVPGQRGIPNNEGVFWRGKLSEISGFSFGSLSSSEE